MDYASKYSIACIQNKILFHFGPHNLIFAPLTTCRLAVDLLAHEHDVEVAKLRDIIANVKCGNISGLAELREEMEIKHTKEMEELRQYFEQKCADVEKQ